MNGKRLWSRRDFLKMFSSTESSFIMERSCGLVRFTSFTRRTSRKTGSFCVWTLGLESLDSGSVGGLVVLADNSSHVSAHISSEQEWERNEKTLGRIKDKEEKSDRRDGQQLINECKQPSDTPDRWQSHIYQCHVSSWYRA